MPAHWLCTTCDKRYDVTPLKCECGAREFAEAQIEAAGFTIAIDVDVVERAPKKRGKR